jgi:phospholipid/cholesterol/gamma-HCH transport system ATP-binding protein
MIEVTGLNKSFGEAKVLKNITASFKSGQVNLIIGQSGSGKSVLAKCIVGLHEIDSGSVVYDGRNFTSMNRHERKEVRKEIGMLFQGSALFDSLTAEENVMFPLSMFTEMKKEEMRDRANFCLERVDLINKNHLLPSECSGGMQKRIAIARAIALNPRYLFCDEPNSGLDPRTGIVIDNLITEITYEYNTTTIVITHDMNSVFRIADRVVMLKNGVVSFNGTPAELRASPDPEIQNFIAGRSGVTA